MMKTNQSRKNIMNEAWWVDLLEGEVDPMMQEDLEMLLSHSITDQIIMENYKSVRRSIKHADPALEYEKLLRDPIYMTKLHDQIMEGLPAQSTETASASLWSRIMWKRLGGRLSRLSSMIYNRS